MNKTHSKEVILKIETDFNKIIPFVIVIAFFSAIFSFFESVPSHLIIADILIIIIFTILEFNKHRIHIYFKIIISVLICFYMGAISYIDVGFESAGAIMFIAGNIVAVLLLKRIYGVLYSLSVVLLYIIVWQLPPLTERTVILSDSEWFVQILVYILIGTLLQTVVFSIKKYLIFSVKDLEKNAVQIENLAYYDQMTGLANSTYFKEVLTSITQSSMVSGFIVFASIKNFDVLTSVYGEELTNALIKETADLLLSQKEQVLVSRVGESSFALWYEEISKDELIKIFDNFTEMFRNRNKINDYKKRIDCYASFYHHNKHDNLENSIQKASMAMTYAKENSLDYIVEYDIAFDKIIREIEKKKELIKMAVEEEAFDVHFQTKVDARDGSIIGVEALARWNTNEYGPISPVEFIPLIEQLNISKDFGNIIVKKTLSKYSLLQDKYGKNISVSINVSPIHLMSSNMVNTLKNYIDKYNVPYNKVVIEITEEVAIIGLNEVNRKLQKLREIGVKVSLDDFGSGYSSLNYLMSFKVDELKIDKSFVDQLESNPYTVIMFESIIHMANQFGLTLIVEGVERKEQLDKLLDLGCHFFQGYYYSKPEQL